MFDIIRFFIKLVECSFNLWNSTRSISLDHSQCTLKKEHYHICIFVVIFLLILHRSVFFSSFPCWIYSSPRFVFIIGFLFINYKRKMSFYKIQLNSLWYEYSTDIFDMHVHVTLLQSTCAMCLFMLFWCVFVYCIAPFWVDCCIVVKMFRWHGAGLGV